MKVCAYTGGINTLTFDISPFAIQIPNSEILEKSSNNSEIIDYERTIYLKAINSKGKIGKSNTKKM